MARVFLDANAVIDLIKRKKDESPSVLEGHSLYISPLSLHVIAYIYKYSCPSLVIKAAMEAINIVPLDAGLLSLAAIGPTADFEDNIQLQSAVVSTCDYVLTSDQSLLKLGVFGKVRVVKSLVD